LTGLPQVLSTRNVIISDEEDHLELYSAILQASDSYERPPIFLREDCEDITSHQVWSIEVPKWLITAARVATGSRRRVLEDGPDTMNSEDEDAKKEERGDELTGMYAPGRATLEDARLSEEQAQLQRAAASSKDTFRSSIPALSAPEFERKPTPLTTPVNSDDEEMSYEQRRALNTGKKMAAKSTPKAPKVAPKAAAPPQAPADQPKGAKAPTPTKGQAKGQESPETKVSTPMETRGQAKTKACRAGGMRDVAGSGQMETGVLQAVTPSKP
jgi:hypothetical protein